MYYVVIGDSLGTGYSWVPRTNGYAYLVHAHERARIPGLKLKNLSCSGATARSIVTGGVPCLPGDPIRA